MTSPPQALDLLRRLLALLVLAAAVAGVPIALWELGGAYLPDELPSWAQVITALGGSDTGGVFLGMLVVIGWTAWACFALSVAVELVSQLRGLPPLLTAALMAIFSDERTTPLQLAGMFTLCCGILSLGLEAGLGSPKLKRAAGWAVLVAVSIGIYTTLDGFGGRLSGHAAAYVAWTCMLEALCLGTWLVARQGPAAMLLVLRRWPITIVGGVVSSRSERPAPIRS